MQSNGCIQFERIQMQEVNIPFTLDKRNLEL